MSSSGGTGTRAEAPPDEAGLPLEDVVLLYAGSREWFRSALEAVLQPEGFSVRWAREVEDVLDVVSAETPDVVIVDERVGEMSAPELCRVLRGGPLPEHVPIVLYSSDGSRGSLQAEALEAGAWEVIREPIRAESLIASLHRLLRIGGLIGQARERRFADRESGLLTVRGLMQMLPSLEAMAERQDVPLSCVVVGPTGRTAGKRLRRQRDLVARLCAGAVRQADLCGWVKDGAVAIVAFDTPPEGARELAERLHRVSEEMAREADDPGAVVSAGIVQLWPLPTRGGAAEGEGSPKDAMTKETVRKETVSILSTAQKALEAARREGGGVRIADPR